MNRIRIAIVDDHELFANGMKSLLEPFEEIEVLHITGNGKELIDQLAATEIHPDVILMDLKMPEMDGVETFEYLKEHYPKIKAVILSMHEDEAFVLHMVKLGVNGYLLKNSTVTEVVTAVKTVFTSDYYYTDFLMKIMHKGLTSGLQSKSGITRVENSDLTIRELEVLDLICQQYTTEEIGEKLFLSKRTVEGYRKKLLQKTQTKNTAGLIVACINQGIVSPEKYEGG